MLCELLSARAPIDAIWILRMRRFLFLFRQLSGPSTGCNPGGARRLVPRQTRVLRKCLSADARKHVLSDFDFRSNSAAGSLPHGARRLVARQARVLSKRLSTNARKLGIEVGTMTLCSSGTAGSQPDGARRFVARQARVLCKRLSADARKLFAKTVYSSPFAVVCWQLVA